MKRAVFILNKDQIVAEISDEYLMDEVRAGKLSSLGELFERYHKQLFNFFLKMTGNRESSEDLVQTTFTRILAYKSSYQQGRSFRTWMYRVARNAQIDLYNEQKLMIDDFAETSIIEAEEPAALDHMLKEERLEALNEALTLLPLDQREVLLLHRFEGMKYDEISKITGSSVVAVRVKAHRALNKLREIYFQVA